MSAFGSVLKTSLTQADIVRDGDLSPTIRHSQINRFRACRQLPGFPARTPTTTNMLGTQKKGSPIRAAFILVMGIPLRYGL